MLKQGARLGRAWENYASQREKTHVLQRIVLYFKGVTINTKNYNQQSCSLHLRKLQSTKPLSAVLYIVEGYDRPTPIKEKTKRKGERKERRKRKGIWRWRDLKTFPLSAPPPLNTFPGPVPSMDRTREQRNSHKGGTREKHNSYKRQNVETERQPAITRQIPCSDDQTLKLHHVRTLTLSKEVEDWGLSMTQTFEERPSFIKKPGTLGKPRSLFQFSIDPH